MHHRLSQLAFLAATALLPTTLLQAQDTSTPQTTTPKLAFSSPKMVNVPASYTSTVGTGDINNDGKTDLLTRGGLLLGDGKGGFTASNIDESRLTQEGRIPVPLVDLNGDGKLDAVQFIPGEESRTDPCVYTPNRMNIFFGDGHGRFTQQSSYHFSNYNNPSAVVADFNHDGKPDVAFLGYTLYGCTSGNNNTVLNVFLNQGNGTFAPAPGYSLGSGNENTTVAQGFNLVTGDFNGDGKLDVAFTGYLADTNGNPVSYNVQTLNGRGDGSFTVGPVYTLDSTPYGLAAADLNGDKRTDLVVFLNAKSIPGATPRIATLLAKQVGGFYWSSSVSIPDVSVLSTVNYYSALGLSPLVDLNRDGKLDLLLPFYNINNPSSVQILAGEGNGRFTAPQSFGVYPDVTEVFALPLTTGARPDLLLQKYDDQREEYYLELLLNQSK